MSRKDWKPGTHLIPCLIVKAMPSPMKQCSKHLKSRLISPRNAKYIMKDYIYIYHLWRPPPWKPFFNWTSLICCRPEAEGFPSLPRWVDHVQGLLQLRAPDPQRRRRGSRDHVPHGFSVLSKSKEFRMSWLWESWEGVVWGWIMMDLGLEMRDHHQKSEFV